MIWSPCPPGMAFGSRREPNSIITRSVVEGLR